MPANISKEFLIQKYKESKETLGRIPKRNEFCLYAGIQERQLEATYGSRAYSKLQTECGDEANKFAMIRTPEEVIMRQYGDLALELGSLPVRADWEHKGLKPAAESLLKRPHFIKWSEFPYKFREWVESENIDGYADVTGWIKPENVAKQVPIEKVDAGYEKLISDVRHWSPARRRNTEGEYKVELRGHLKSVGYQTNEEFGESKVDLLIGRKYLIETKKDPNLAEYDRLFGQIARHLQHGEWVIVVIMDVPREDQYQNFMLLVDKYLNKNGKFVEVMKK